jgi:hypothetical protein
MKALIKSKLTTGVLLLGVLMVGDVSATYMTLDWQEDDDARAFLDESTGIEWLGLVETQSMSINEVVAELGVGGLYDGWRLPTAIEVSSLATKMTGYSTKQNVANETSNNESVLELYYDFSEAFGWLYTKTSGSSWGVHYDYRSYGLYLDDENVLMSGARWRKNPQSSSRTYYSSYSYVDYDSPVTNYTESFSDESYGVFLVADGGATLTTQRNMSLVSNNPNAVSVSEPTGAALMGLGLLGMGMLRRRTKK